MQSFPADVLRRISDYLTPNEVYMLTCTNKEIRKEMVGFAFRSLLRACTLQYSIDARTLAPSGLSTVCFSPIIFNSWPENRIFHLVCPLSDVTRLVSVLVSQGFTLTPYSVYRAVVDREYPLDHTFLDVCPFDFIPFQKGSFTCFVDVERDEVYFQKERYTLNNGVWQLPRYYLNYLN